MSAGRTHFSLEEAAAVVSHYDVGVIHQTRRLSGGSRDVPKIVVITDQGKFLLKRRPKGKANLHHVDFAHGVQGHLAEHDFPVTTLMATREDNSTVFEWEDSIYELFKFVTGSRYDGSAEATVEAGRQLAGLHLDLTDFSGQGEPLKGSFHDALIVRRHLRAAGGRKAERPSRQLQHIAEVLMELYNASSVRVNELGFDSWAEQVVHGDWHPGNMLFRGRKLVAVLDFDSARVAPRVTDLANGMLQFSIVGGRPNPADWPAYLDEQKVTQFLDGYRDVIEPGEHELRAVLDLMIETMIAEAILPVAATGFFGHLCGVEFLKMIRRKCEWIIAHRESLAEAIGV
ncbi:MAG TPA: phosphotransferase [Sedimentisphaerales bacterium]|nr:phosphotransferase [Sedimentisphaerales bacterium]